MELTVDCVYQYYQLSPQDAALLRDVEMAIQVRLSLWFRAWNSSYKV